MADPIEQALRDAVQGLMYRSETDQPFEAFTWQVADALTPDEVRSLGNHPADDAVSETSFDEFAAALTTDKSWHDDDERATVQQYRQLFALMRERLTDLTVFRVGKTDITVYFVGRTKEGDWAGVMTWAVET